MQSPSSIPASCATWTFSPRKWPLSVWFRSTSLNFCFGNKIVFTQTAITILYVIIFPMTCVRLFRLLIIVVKRQARQIPLARVLCSLFQEARAQYLQTPPSPCHADQEEYPIRLLPIERERAHTADLSRDWNRIFISPTFAFLYANVRKGSATFLPRVMFVLLINKSYPRRIYSLRLKLICSIMDGENRC